MAASDITVVITSVGKPRAELLQRAIRSVQAQTLEPDSIVISIDTPREGAAYCRQRGFEQVRTKYVAWLDDDDEMKEQHLQRLKETIEGQDVDLVYPWYDVINGGDPLTIEGRPWTADNMGLFPVTYLVKAQCVRDAGGWAPEGYTPEAPSHGGEDWQLQCRMRDMGVKMYHLNERTWNWWHQTSNTSGLPNRVDWSASSV